MIKLLLIITIISSLNLVSADTQGYSETSNSSRPKINDVSCIVVMDDTNCTYATKETSDERGDYIYKIAQCSTGVAFKLYNDNTIQERRILSQGKSEKLDVVGHLASIGLLSLLEKKRAKIRANNDLLAITSKYVQCELEDLVN